MSEANNKVLRFCPNYNSGAKSRGSYIPDLTLPPEKEYPPLGKYSRMRLSYLKENKKALFSVMLMDGTLNSHLHEIDEQANKILEQTVKAFAEADGCDEELKSTNQMKWVGLM